MIPAGVKVFLASHPIDFRKGPDSLLSLVRDAGSDPFNGSLYVFRAKRAQLPTFCIRFPFCEDRISLASAVREQGASLAVSPRQEPDVNLYG
ncbi:IS66 family insertion sequence element accessory protein TnpB [Rhizobium mesoamericanum]|uniref:Transposase n=1 Tax=Rhizobium mesoamericanum STM3625 TaxID=1211777 RepID=K0Q6D6_9HYPH|nr:hypothetical protein BN77_p30106 [Rhizobium mesoamericanum STM3625]